MMPFTGRGRRGRASWRIYQKLASQPNGRTVCIKADPRGSLSINSIARSRGKSRSYSYEYRLTCGTCIRYVCNVCNFSKSIKLFFRTLLLTGLRGYVACVENNLYTRYASVYVYMCVHKYICVYTHTRTFLYISILLYMFPEYVLVHIQFNKLTRQ